MRRYLKRLLNFFRPRRAEREMTREIEAHLDVVASDFESRGLPKEDARRAARRAIGGVEQTKESHRHTRSFPFLESVIRDLGYAVRTLLGAGGFSLAVMGSLSLGIAAVVSATAFINAAAFHPYPGVEDPTRVVDLIVGAQIPLEYFGEDPGFAYTPLRTTMGDYPATHSRLAEGLPSMEAVASRLGGEISATLPEARALRAALVSANYFDVLGVEPRIGRTFAPGEDGSGEPAIAVIGHALWLSGFAADPEIVGRTIGIGNQRVQIIGVAPPDFAGADHNFARRGHEIWLPIGLAEHILPPDRETGLRTIYYFGRTKPGVGIERVDAELEVLASQVVPAGFGSGAPIGFAARAEMFSRQRIVPTLAVLMPIPILVLAIGCLNAANLLLARMAGRRREIAVRLSVGGSRWRIARQLVTESLLLSAGATIVALPMARAGLDVARSFLILPMPIDAGVGAVAAATAFVTALAFSLIPALRAASGAPNLSLGTARASVDGSGVRSRGRRALVAAQVALSLGLVATGAQLVASLEALGGAAGTDPDRLLMVSFELDQLGFSDLEADRFYEELAARVSTLGGVEAVALADPTVLWKSTGGFEPYNSIIVGLPDVDPDEDRIWSGGHVAGEFFTVVGLEPVEGRAFNDADRTGDPRVAVVTEALVSQLFDGRALGRFLRVRGREDGATSYQVEVVGVVPSPTDPQRGGDVPAVFLPSPIGEQLSRGLYVRTRGPATGLVREIRKVVGDINPRVPILEAASLRQMNRARIRPERGLADAAAFLGIVALVLAALGLYGVTDYMVAARSGEIAIRLALGALPARVARMFLREGLITVALGVAIGGTATFVSGRWIQSQMFDAGETNLNALGGAAALLFVVMLVATLIPALRAASIDPVRSLRQE